MYTAPGGVKPKDFTRYIIFGIDFIGDPGAQGNMMKLGMLSHSGNILLLVCELRTEIRSLGSLKSCQERYAFWRYFQKVTAHKST